MKSRPSSVVVPLNSNNPYDAVFHRIAHDCRELLIPLATETSGIRYSDSAKVRFLSETYTSIDSHNREIRNITDCRFEIIDSQCTAEAVHVYMAECETNPKHLAKKMEPYLDAHKMVDFGETRFRVALPHGMMICLRSDDIEADKIEMEDACGNVSTVAKLIKMKDYEMEDLLAKKLYILIPFHIFKHEKDFARYENNEKALDQLANIYRNMIKKLSSETSKGKLSQYTFVTIVELTKIVLDDIARKHQNIRKKVGEVMNSVVIENPATTIYLSGYERGDANGYARGDANGYARGDADGYVRGNADGYARGCARLFMSFATAVRAGYMTEANAANTLGIAIADFWNKVLEVEMDLPARS